MTLSLLEKFLCIVFKMEWRNQTRLATKQFFHGLVCEHLRQYEFVTGS